MLLVKATRPVNLHSASFKGSNNQPIAGLILVPAEIPMQVPDDVQDEPGFALLQEDEMIEILDHLPDPEPVAKEPKPEETESEDEDEDEEKKTNSEEDGDEDDA